MNFDFRLAEARALLLLALCLLILACLGCRSCAGRLSVQAEARPDSQPVIAAKATIRW